MLQASKESEVQSTNTDYSSESEVIEPFGSGELQKTQDVELVSEVLITEVVSPDLIYTTPKTIDLSSFKEKCRKLAHCKVVPDNFDINTYVLGLSEADGIWYRGLILERHELLKFKVRLLDYGSTDIFRKNNLRSLKKGDLEEPLFCYACKLYDVAPNGEKWNEKSKNLIMEMIDQ